MAGHYWHTLSKNLKKSQYETALSKFIAPELQLQCFMDLLEVLDSTPFNIVVHPWDTPDNKSSKLLEFNGENWIIMPSPPSTFYVPLFLRHFVSNLRGE